MCQKMFVLHFVQFCGVIKRHIFFSTSSEINYNYYIRYNLKCHRIDRELFVREVCLIHDLRYQTETDGQKSEQANPQFNVFFSSLVFRISDERKQNTFGIFIITIFLFFFVIIYRSLCRPNKNE